MTEEHIKEAISRGYVNIIASNAGLSYAKPDFDYGIDGTFKDVKSRENRLVESGYSIDFQLKATVTAEFEGECIKYNLEAKNYNDLVDDDVMTPRILILYTLPREPKEWVSVNENMTVLKNCAWWCSLKGEKLTDNSHKKTIRIPKKQLLTSETLSELMNKIKRGEEI